ncbi:MAG: hypothetical protein HOB22_09770 [Candidatus Marinimicrobia bacterium]|nr:hypothetical protein [Candidatus Neomarinimicrobiota bacterium]
MEKINENGLEIFKGEKLIIVTGAFRFQEVFYDFVDGLLQKDYVIIELVLGASLICALSPKE